MQLNKLCNHRYLYVRRAYINVSCRGLVTLTDHANGIETSQVTRGENEQKTEVETVKNGFNAEFMKNQIEISGLQKILLGMGSSVAALINPRRNDMIAALSETSGESTLHVILRTMQNSAEGQRILAQRPRINTRTTNIEDLRKLPEQTFGRAYAKFLEDNQVTPDSRMPVRFVADCELAYVMTRYRECHDLVHTILNMPTHMLGEVAVKWVEALNNGLPMCYGAAIFGAARLRPKQRRKYMSLYLPWAIKTGQRIKPLMPVFWEERWEQNVEDLRSELGIKLLQ